MADDSSAAPAPAGPEGVPKQRFIDAYASGDYLELWESGRPQPAFLKLLDEGKIRGRVLDFGCGTGETAIACSRRGFEVVGVDIAPAAISEAERKRAALEAQGTALPNLRFVLDDLLEVDPAEALVRLEGPLDSVLDAAVFHVFSDALRPRYAALMEQLLKPGGALFVLAFSEHEPGGGPRRVTQAELRHAFGSEAWRARGMNEATYEASDGPRRAWLGEFERRGS